ncbi:MAG: restriction endonuclease subunit S, partial [Ruminococcus sp.]|nr:restriction endonuclease subunit S [Ruminococcus sp.]
MKLTDIIEIIGGGTPKTSRADYWNGDIPWLSVKDFNNDNCYVYSTEKSITQAGLENSSTKLLRKDDIIISARGTVGELAMIPYPMAFNQSCYGIRGKECVDKSFLYYLLKHNIYKLKVLTHGSVFDTITRNTFEQIEINLPDLETQQKIGSVLKSLDDKIELNNRINKNLEEQAQAIFKSWFVDFVPFGGVMPADWKITTLGETTSKFATGLNPRKNFVLGQ